MKPVRALSVCAVSACALAALSIVIPSAAPAAYASSPFSSCTEAYAAGYANIPASHPYYAKALDRDSDGIACDKPPADFTPAPAPTAKPSATRVPAPGTSMPSAEDDLAETGGTDPVPWVLGAVFLASLGATVLGLCRQRRNR